MITVLVLLLAALFAIFNADTVFGFLLPQQTVNEMGTQLSTPAPQPTSIAINTETEAVLLELRRQYLDDRAETINWWLIAVAIALAFITLMVVAAGFVGYQVFRGILEDARRYRDEAQCSAKESSESLSRTLRVEVEAQESATTISSLRDAYFVGSEDQATYADVLGDLDNADAIDRAMSEAIDLQNADDSQAAMAKWISIAEILRGTDDPRCADAWFYIGRLSGQTDDHGAAICAYDKALQRNPEDFRAYNNRGTEKSKLGRLVESLEDFRAAIERNPTDGRPHSNLGAALWLLEDRSQAKVAFDKALELADQQGNSDLRSHIERAMTSLNVV